MAKICAPAEPSDPAEITVFVSVSESDAVPDSDEVSASDALSVTAEPLPQPDSSRQAERKTAAAAGRINLYLFVRSVCTLMRLNITCFPVKGNPRVLRIKARLHFRDCL